MIQYFPVLEKPLESDLQLVIDFGGVDLRAAYSTGSVPGNLQGTEDNSNGIESPSAIVGRPDDIFALHRASSAYSEAAAPAAASSAGSPSNDGAASGSS